MPDRFTFLQIDKVFSVSNWLTATGSFEMGNSEDNVFRMMANVGAVNHLPTSTKPLIEWEDPTLNEVHIVLSSKRDATELEVSPEKINEVDVLMFSVTYNWMAEEFLHPRTGPWNILSYVALTLARLDNEQALRVPTLIDPDD